MTLLLGVLPSHIGILVEVLRILQALTAGTPPVHLLLHVLLHLLHLMMAVSPSSLLLLLPMMIAVHHILLLPPVETAAVVHSLLGHVVELSPHVHGGHPPARSGVHEVGPPSHVVGAIHHHVHRLLTGDAAAVLLETTVVIISHVRVAHVGHLGHVILRGAGGGA